MEQVKQTAIDWLIEQWPILESQLPPQLIEQAKKMEKEQIIEAHGSKLKNSKGATNYEYWYTGEDYYKETFKSE